MITSKIIREFQGKKYVCVDAIQRHVLGALVADTYWVECNANGDVTDTDADGIISNLTLMCKVPEGHENLDVSTLDKNCLDKAK